MAALAGLLLAAPAVFGLQQVEFRLVMHNQPETTVEAVELSRPITNPVSTERGVVIQTIGVERITWARNVRLNGTPLFERYHEGRYIDRLPVARRQLEAGEHLLWPGDHAFTLAADGTLSSDSPELLIDGQVVSIKAYPVVIGAYRANPPEGDLPAGMRLAPLPNLTLREAANHQDSLPNPERQGKRAAPLELLPEFAAFAPLTIWLPANTIGQGYWVHPLGLTFHLTGAGVVEAGAGEGSRLAAVDVRGAEISVPLYRYPVVGQAGVALVADGVERLEFNERNEHRPLYTNWFPKADDYVLRVAADGLEIRLDGGLRDFPEKSFAVDQRDPARRQARAIAVELQTRHLAPGTALRARLRTIDPGPTAALTTAMGNLEEQMRVATAAVDSQEADGDRKLAALRQRLAELQRRLAEPPPAAAEPFAELQGYDQSSWQPLTIRQQADAVVEIDLPAVDDGLYRLRLGRRGAGAPPLYTDSWVTIARPRPFGTGLFTPRGRTAFPRGESFWIGLGMTAVAGTLPAGAEVQMSMVDPRGTRLPLLGTRLAAAVGERDTQIVRFSPAGSLALAPGSYRVEATVGGVAARPLAIELVESEPETTFLNLMNGKYSPQGKIYQNLLQSGQLAEELAADLADTGYNGFVGMTYDISRVTRANLDLEQLVRERPELGPWESYYQPSHRDRFLDASVRHRLRFWENMITYHDTMLPRNTPILEATGRFCALETASMVHSPAFQGICMYDEIYNQAQQGIPEFLYRSFAEWQELHYRQRHPELTSERAIRALERFTALPAGQRRQEDVEAFRTWPDFEDFLWADFSRRGAAAAKRAMPDSRNFVQHRFFGSNGNNIFSFGTPYGVHQPFEIAATVMYKDGGAGDRPVFAPMQADVLRTRDDLLVTTQLHSFSAPGIYGRHILRQAFFALSQKTDGFTYFTLPHSLAEPSQFDWRDPIRDIARHLTTPYGDLFVKADKGYGRVAIYASRAIDQLAGRKPISPKTAAEGLWVACVRAGFPADFIYDEHVLAGRAKEFDVVFFPGVHFEEEVPPAILRELQAVVDAGKLLVVERGSRLPLEGIVRADSTFDEYDGKSGAFPRYIDFESEMVWDQSEELTRVVRDLLRQRQVPPAAEHELLVGPDWLRSGDGHFLLLPNFAFTEWTGLHKTLYQAPSQAILRFPKRPPAVYDVLAMQRREATVDGDWMQVTVDMRHLPGALWAFLPAPIEAVRLWRSPTPTAGQPLQYRLAVVDAAGATIDAGMPFEISILKPGGEVAHRLYRAGTPTYQGVYALPINAEPGEWTLRARELISGQVAESRFSLQPGTATPAALDDRPVWLSRQQELAGFLAGKEEIVIAVDVDQDWLRPAAERLAQTLATAGRPARVAELNHVLRLPKPWDAMNPEIDGARLWRGNLVEPGLFVDAPLIILGRRNENRLLEALQRRDLLPMPVSENFPAAGRGVVGWLPWAFSNQHDTVVIMANEPSGLEHAIAALLQLGDPTASDSPHPAVARPESKPETATAAGQGGVAQPTAFRDAISLEAPIHTLDVDAADGRVLVGTSGYGHNLFCLDADGKLLWKAFLPEHNVYFARFYDDGRRVVAATGRGFFDFLLDGRTGAIQRRFAATEYPRYHGYWTHGGEGAVDTKVNIQLNPAQRQILIGGRTGLLAITFEGEKMWFRDLAEAVAAVPREAEASGDAGSYQESAALGSFVLSPDGSRVATSEFYRVGTTVINTKMVAVWAHYPHLLAAADGEILLRNDDDPGNQTSPAGWHLEWPAGLDLPIVRTASLEAPLLAGGVLGDFEHRPGRPLPGGDRLLSQRQQISRLRPDRTPAWQLRQGELWLPALDVMSPDLGRLYRNDRTGLLHCLDLGNGKLHWQAQLPFTSVLKATADGLLAGANNGTVARFDTDGRQLWSVRLGDLHELPGHDYPEYVQAALRQVPDSTGDYFPVGEDRPGDYDQILRLGLEQVTDGSFATADAWQSSTGQLQRGQPAWQDDQALQMGDRQLVTQRLTRRVIPTATYLLEFHYRLADQATALTAGVLLEGPKGETLTASRFAGAPGQWLFGRLAVKTHADSAGLTIGFEAEGGGISVDGVSLRPVRFPSANLLANHELHLIEPTFVSDFRVNYARVPAEVKRKLMSRSHVTAFIQGGTNVAPSMYQEQAFLHNGRLDCVGRRWTYTPDPIGFSVVLARPSYVSHLVLHLNNTTPDNTYAFISIIANNLEAKQEELVKLVRGNRRRFVVVHFEPALHTDHLKILPGMHRGHMDCLTEVEVYGPLGGPQTAAGKEFADDPTGMPMFMGGPAHRPREYPADLVGSYREAPAVRLNAPPPYASDPTVVLGSLTVNHAGGSILEFQLPELFADEAARREAAKNRRDRLQDGRRWEIGTLTPTTTPARYAGRLLVGTVDGRMHAVADDGGYLWNFATAGRIYSSPLPDGDDLYFGSDDGKLYKIDVDSGILIWEFATGDKVRGAPALAGRTVVFPSWDGFLHAVHADTGEALWKSPIAAYTSASPAIDQGRVYLGDEQGAMYGFDLASGRQLWQRKLPDRLSRCPVVAPGGILFAGDGGALAMLAADGRELWQARLAGRLAGQPKATQGQLFIPGSHGLTVLRQADGQPDDRLELPIGGGQVLAVVPYRRQLFVLAGGIDIEERGGRSFTMQYANLSLWQPQE